jgi:hypothetical protein
VFPGTFLFPGNPAVVQFYCGEHFGVFAGAAIPSTTPRIRQVDRRTPRIREKGERTKFIAVHGDCGVSGLQGEGKCGENFLQKRNPKKEPSADSRDRIAHRGLNEPFAANHRFHDHVSPFGHGAHHGSILPVLMGV